MPKIAEVIVDVPAMQTDQPFSYMIPIDLEMFLAAGMRVEVPFGKGSRHVQGFIVAIRDISQEELDESEFTWKELIRVLDLYPVLNEELLALADEMKERTFSFKITCLQTMLPAVMRAAYQKWIVLTGDISAKEQRALFYGQNEITWEEAESAGNLPALMKLRRAGLVELRYEVKQKNKIKTEKIIQPLLTESQYRELKEQLRQSAKNKRHLLEVLIMLEGQPCSVKEAVLSFDVSRSSVTEGAKLGWLALEDVEVYRDPFKDQIFMPQEKLALTDEQTVALEAITDSMAENKSDVFLLEGVTGSGKTEVYLQAIAAALKEGKSAIMLVPEISLTPQTVERFKSRFGDEVAVLHSGLSQGEKYDEWRKIEREEAKVVVGARSAVFAPLKKIGLMIIDEEHEATYKQDDTPRYHARDLAIWRGNYHGCPVVLGSATPSLESRARAQKKVYRLLHLTKRAAANASLPEVSVIDMRKEMKEKTSGTFSETLKKEINERLLNKEQTVLLLNRRGYSSFIMCRDCGYVLPCPNCDISLTLHMDTKKMKCHYCGHEEPIPHRCPICASDKMRYYGTGTQKVEEELQQLFPASRILRMDVDTTRKKGAHEKLLRIFGSGEADILLGTQMIAKGLDFPNVTLVGVLNADTALNLPDFRSSEHTFQLLTQVSGRAGRGDKPGKVVIQTFNPEHYAIVLAQKQDYEAFYAKEMPIRHEGDYPPYYFTAMITTSHTEEVVAAKKMFEIMTFLKSQLSPACILLGPTPKAVARINNRYFYQTILKYKQEPKLSGALKKILQETQKDTSKGLNISIDMEPMHFI